MNTKTIIAWKVMKLWEKNGILPLQKDFLWIVTAAYILCRMWNEKSAVSARGDSFAVQFGLRGGWRSPYNWQTCKVFMFVYKYSQITKVTK